MHSPVASATALEPVAPSSTPPAQPSTAIPSRPTSWLRRHWIKTVASIAIAAGFVWGLHKADLDFFPTRQQLADVKWGWVALHAVLLMALHVIRALRWRHLLRPIAPEIGWRRVLAASWIGFFAILMLPLRTGEVYRPYLLRDGKKITMSAALGTTGAERVIDGLVVTLVLAGALFFVPRIDPLPQSVGKLNIPVATIPALGFIALGVFVAAFIAMALFYFARDFARKLVDATIGRVSKKLGDRISSIVEGVANGLHFLSGPRYAVPFLLETIVYWGLNAVLMWILGFAVGLPLDFGHACAVMGVLAVGILVPAGPGLFGAFQAATYGALAMFFTIPVVTTTGRVYVFLLYVVQFVWHIIAAGIAVKLDPQLLRKADTISQQT